MFEAPVYLEHLPLSGLVLFTRRRDLNKHQIPLPHSYVFWVGDMNFRFESHMTTEIIAKHIAEGNLSALVEVDELRQAQKKGDAFSMFTEGKLSFPPTYKYLEDTQEYDLT